MKAKLILITDDGEVGGGPAHILEILKGVDSKKFETHLISPTGWLKNQIKALKLNASHHLLPAGDRFFEGPLLLRELLQEIKNRPPLFAPLIIHVHSPRSFITTAKASNGLGAHLVYTEHLWTEAYFELYKNRLAHKLQLKQLKNTLKQASSIIAVSKSVKEFYGKYQIAEAEKIQVVYPNLKDLPKLKTAKQQKLIKPLIKKYIIGSIGSFNSTKNYRLLIEAIAILAKKISTFQMEIVGGGPDLENINQAISDHGLRARVSIISDVKTNQLKDYYKKWDLYVQPSLSESFGLAILEAEAFGLPVVALKVGGVSEVVHAGVSGFLINKNDPKLLAAAIEKIISDQELLFRMSEEAILLSQQPQFNGRENLKKIMVIYQSLISY